MYGGSGSRSGYSPHEHLFSRLAGIYPNLPRLRQDITSLLQTIQSLRPNVGVFGSGRNQVQLFYLYGTVPIVFSGATYNIPMTVYFDPPYPSVPPRCFVSPTAGMSIKPRHQHVDHNGMVYLPYLNTWSPYSSTLPELVTIIASTFSADPPVYSTGPPQQQQQQQQPQPQTIRPVNGPTATGGIGQPAASKVQPSGVVQNSSGSAVGNDRRQSAYAAKLRLQEVEDRTTEMIEKTREYNLARETAATAVKEAQVWLAGPKSTASTDSTNADEQESKLKSELGAQVLELVEEDCSLDEWLLGLDDALKSNSIDIEAYLREIRSTSRKQFEVRALRQKAVTQLQAAIIYKEEQEQRQRPSTTTAGPSGPTINSYPAQSTGYVMAYPAPRWG